MAVARPTESASITQPHAYVNSIGPSRDLLSVAAACLMASLLVLVGAVLVGGFQARRAYQAWLLAKPSGVPA
jgi:hypothetical protein